ncbi:MAG: OsmC family protein [Brooklawnia sp.]|uniref:OsmC family protein n=1 Tax=Brooklawnia sp. TaxID=2699740 RepID=UPI003C777ABB
MTDQHDDTEVTLVRLDRGSYQARNSRGTTIEVGIGKAAFTPGELFLAAIGACTTVDVDIMTSRRAEPELFEVTTSGRKSTEGGNHYEDLTVTFRLRFPEGPAGDAARTRIPAAVRASRERDCTVSRTVEAGTPIDSVVSEPNPADE